MGSSYQTFISEKWEELRAQKYKIQNIFSSWEQFSLLSAQAALVETHRPLMIDDDKDFFLDAIASRKQSIKLFWRHFD